MNQREIKFRCWDKEKKQFYIPEDNQNIAIGLDGTIWLVCFEEYYPWQESVSEKYEVMQFTNLLDKHGKEIYEGDIVKTDFREPNEEEKELLVKIFGSTEQKNEKFYKGKIWEVGWLQHLHLIENRSYLGDLESLAPINLEIIGNIYENPSLLATPTSPGGEK